MLNKKQQSLESILSGFQKTVDQLTSLIDTNAEKVVVNNEKVNQLKEENDALISETKKADSVKSKLLGLISD